MKFFTRKEIELITHALQHSKNTHGVFLADLKRYDPKLKSMTAFFNKEQRLAKKALQVFTSKVNNYNSTI